MNKDQAGDVLRAIGDLYPNTFQVTETKVKLLIPQLEKMDYERVMANLSSFAATNKFPPTISEIAGYTPEHNDSLEKMRKWKEEADKVDPAIKERFKRDMEKLLKDKSKNAEV
jgi:ribosomal protein L12E/L44/L45/RPP1/RPP2